MTRHFDDELGKVKKALLTMGSYAESTIAQAVEAVTDRNDRLAEQVQNNDDIMDQYEKEINDMAIILPGQGATGHGFAAGHRRDEDFAKPGARRRRSDDDSPARGRVDAEPQLKRLY